MSESPVNRNSFREKSSEIEVRHEEFAPSSHSENLDFGNDSKLPAPPRLTAEEEKRLWRKIDLRLMPILSLMYLFSFLDRGAY